MRKVIRYREGDPTVMSIRCRNCLGCRMDKTRDWAIRCAHEAHTSITKSGLLKGAPDASFLTLTYDDAHLPHSVKKVKADHQKFIKRARKALSKLRDQDVQLRYLHSGEYGEKSGRPHAHTLLYGESFADCRRPIKRLAGGGFLYASPVLDRLWRCQDDGCGCEGSYGFASIGTVSFASAAYVARYALKKANGEMAEIYPEELDASTGEIVPIPPYSTMSKQPPIGRPYYDRYRDEMYKHDSTVLAVDADKTETFRIPRTYDEWFKKEDPREWENVRDRRIENYKKRRALDPRGDDEIRSIQKAIAESKRKYNDAHAEFAI